MKSFRETKVFVASLLLLPEWQQELMQRCVDVSSAKQLVNALIGMLARQDKSWQAIWGIGRMVAFIASHDKEEARVIMRRFMWSLNEESGNIGWGIPEAMGAVIAQNQDMAREYIRILFSYCTDTGREDNFIDHAPLRKGAYWAAGHVAAYHVALAPGALQALAAGLHDELTESRALCCWGLARLLRAMPEADRHNACARLEESATLQALADLSACREQIVLLQDDTMREITASALVEELREAMLQHGAE